MSPGEIERDIDFGYGTPPSPQTAVVGDTVWWDGNQNGLRDPGEAGIPGVTVQLINASTNQPVPGFTAVTNANGEYLFTNVPPGTYYVRAVSGVPSGATPSAGAPNPTSSFTVQGGDTYLKADIGYVRPQLGAIGGTVWEDANRNGVLDGGETRIPSVSVSLIDPATGGVIATTTTDANGDYLFTGLPAGTYQVKVTDTQNVLATYALGPLGPQPGVDNNSQQQPYTVTIGPGQTNTTGDFGYVESGPRNGVIGNQVWYDVNGNGVYEPNLGEVGIEGVTVELLNQSGQVIATTTTGASGDYVFTGLMPGTYQVRVTDVYGVLNGYTPTTYPADQSGDNTNKRQPYTVVLPQNGINMTADFGYNRGGGVCTLLGAIGDFIWYDANTDGIQNVGEPGIPNITVALFTTGADNISGNGDDVLVDNTVTDADGGYLFRNVKPGVYNVRVTDANDRLSGLTQIVGNQAQSSPSTSITLGQGQINKDIDFAYFLNPLDGKAVIGDTVFLDGNGDGLQQPGEPGLPGIQVCAAMISGGPLNTICATTNQNGHYWITVSAGTHDVAPTNPPSGLSVTTPASRQVKVNADDQVITLDFGYRSTSLLGSIGDFVFEDANRNGMFDAGEAPLPGVSVDLIRDLNDNMAWDPGEPIIATDTTNPNGYYLFTGVPEGEYLVHVSDTNGVLLYHIKSTLGQSGVDGHNQIDPSPVTLRAGRSRLTVDFGYYNGCNQVGVIGNQVWIETDGDGVFDPNRGDFGQPGVTVELLDSSLNVIATTTTGASGDYLFAGLAPGRYSVRITDIYGVLAGYIPTTNPTDQTADGTNKRQPYGIVLSLGGRNLTADFGFAQKGNVIFLPMVLYPGGVCVTGRVQVNVAGIPYDFSLVPDGNVKYIKPLLWCEPTVFNIVGYEGSVIWTQYAPFYTQQVGGYQFTFPGGYNGDPYPTLC